MPRPRLATTAGKPFDRLRPENMLAEVLAPFMLDKLITIRDEREAIKNFRALRKWLRLLPEACGYFDLALAKGRGHPRGSSLAKDAKPKDRFLALAVRAGIRPSTVLRELCKVQTPVTYHYQYLTRRVKALGPLWPDAYINELKRMDPATCLTFVKIAAPTFDLPAELFSSHE